MTCNTRCTGHCCKAFTLPWDIDELRRKATTLTDGPYVADMVIPLYSGSYADMPGDIKVLLSGYRTGGP